MANMDASSPLPHAAPVRGASVAATAAPVASAMVTDLAAVGSAARLRNMGPREALSSLMEEFRFNPAIAEKVRRLEQRGYTGWRRIRGDGNCYYRSVGFGVLEQLVVAAGPRRLAHAAELVKRLSTVSFVDEPLAAAHKELLERVERLGCGAGWEQPRSSDAELTSFGLLYRSLHDPQNGIDLALIRALRRLTADYMTKHADDEGANNGISFTAICVCGGEYTGVEDFCARVVLPDGMEAESLCQQALPTALGVGVRIAFLDRSDKDITFHDFGVREAPDMPMVHVQLRPGHYDLLYFREVAEALSPWPARHLGGREAAGSASESPVKGRPPTLGNEDFGELQRIPAASRSRRPASARRKKPGLCM